ncbi:MAG: hypothetical protein K6G30_12110 [Acetatifactor sp.]|nr:hypothetical protein [Acetatifactor sp.]
MNSGRWILISEDSEMVTLGRKTNKVKQYIFFNKSTKSVHCHQEVFYLHDDGMFETQQAETSEWIKYSAKYGSWHIEDLEIDLDTAKLILELIERNGGIVSCG